MRQTQTASSLEAETPDISMPSRPFSAKFDSAANWSGEQIRKGQEIRRWEIDGEETYEPDSLTKIISKIADGRGGKVRDADHAAKLVERFGHKNVFFVTSVGRRSVSKKRAKGSWSSGQIKGYIGRHAKFFFLHDRVNL